MLRSGVDLIEIVRVEEAVRRHGDRFLMRVYTARELALCRGRIDSLAARFAAKEAAAKALGTGLWRCGIGWRDIEVDRCEETGEPLLRLHGAAAERAAALGLHQWSVSLTHDRTTALAMIVAAGEPAPPTPRQPPPTGDRHPPAQP